MAGAAPAPKQIKVACSSNANGTLRYVARAGQCDAATEKVVKVKPGPVQVCVKRHGTLRTLGSASFRRLPAGSTRLVDDMKNCGPRHQPNEMAMQLPHPRREWFCVQKSSGTLRWANRKPHCRKGEFVAYVRPGNPPVVSGNEGDRGGGGFGGGGGGGGFGGGGGGFGGGQNRDPVAVADSATTDEDHSKVISVLANDTDADGDTLHVASVDTTGTVGTVTVNTNGTITYNPNGQFESLKPGDTATDTFKYRANDGQGTSNAATVTVTITGVNDPPVVTTSTGTTPYTENGAPIAVDGAVTVSDIDNPNVASATVRISAGFQPGDALHFTNQGGITGNYSSGTGVLTLTGSATKASYQTALRSITFDSTGDNPGASKTVEFKANDGGADSAAATKGLAITAVNDAPTLDLDNSAGGNDSSASFTEDSGAAALAPNAAVADVDSANLASATVTLTTNPDGLSESLSAVTTGTSITSAGYDSGTGVLTLSGSDTVAHYQQVLRTVAYNNSSNTPTTATARNIDFKVNDGALNSTVAHTTLSVAAHNDAPTADDQSVSTNEDTAPVITLTGSDPEGSGLTYSVDQPAHGSVTPTNSSSVTYTPNLDFCGTTDSFTFHVNDGTVDSANGTVTITVNCVNDAPVVDLNGTGNGGIDNSAFFQEDAGAAVLASGADVSDVDSANLVSATVTLTTNPDGLSESLSAVTTGTSITSAGYDSGTGVLSLSGSDTVAHYQQVLRTVAYNNSSNTPTITTTRNIDFKLNDGALNSTVAHTTLSLADHDDAPVADNQSTSTNEDTPLLVLLTGSDPEGNGLTYSVDQPAHGSVTPTNSSSVTYTPNLDFCGTTDSFTFHVNDGLVDSANGTVTITVNCVNDAPVVDLNGTGTGGIDNSASFTEDAGAAVLASGADVSDVDSANLVSATVTLTTNPDGLSESLSAVTTGTSIVAGYDSGSGVLTLSGSASKADYQQVLRTVAYDNSSNTPTTASARNIDFKVNDGALDSVVAHTTLSVAAHNDAPTADDQSVSTNEDTAPVIILTGSDPEGSGLTYSVDQPAHGSVTPTNSSSVTYTPNLDFCGTTDSFTFHVNDGSLDSANGTVTITVNCVNDAPTVDLDNTQPGNGSSASFFEQVTHTGGAVPLAPNADVADVDSTDIVSADIKLTTRPDGPAEVLEVNTGATGITADPYVPSTGLLHLHGVASKAAYQQVLRTATYRNDAAPPNPASRSIEFTVNDGALNSPVATATVSVVPLNTPPALDLNGSGGGLDETASFTEDAGPATLAPDAVAVDADDTDLTSATVTLTTRPDAGAESLSAVTAGTSITADAYVPSTGVLHLHGTDSVANYQQVLRTVQYDNSSNTPTAGNRNIDFLVNDGQADSNMPHVTLSVTPANDAPAVDLNGSGSGGINTNADWTEDGGAIVLAGLTEVSDVDNANLASATVTLTNRPDGDAAESLSVTIPGGNPITTTGYSSSTGVLSLTGSATLAQYQSVLRTVKYDNSDQDADTTNRVVQFKVNDGMLDSPVATATATIHVLNDPPVVNLAGVGPGIDTAAAFTEDSAPQNPGSGPVQIGPNTTVTDVDNATIASATITLTNPLDGAAESLSVTVPGGSGITASTYDSGTGLLTLTGSSSKLNYETALRSVKYNNTSNTPNTTARVVNVTVSDGTDSSATAKSTVSVTPTNDAPTAVNDIFNGTDSAIANTALVVDRNTGPGNDTPDPSGPQKTTSGNILFNDSDVDGPAPLSVKPETNKPTTNGGKVDIESDGDFTFYPKPGASCTDPSDSFTYSPRDAATPTPADGSGTVTIAQVGPCIWYVNSTAAAGGDGTSHAQFNSVAPVAGAGGSGDADGPGSTIFLYGNGTTYANATSLPLETNQSLIGQPEGLSAGSTVLESPSGSTSPVVSNSAGPAVELASGTTVRRVSASGTTAGFSGSGVNTADVGPNLTASSTSGPALDLSGGNGAIVFNGTATGTGSLALRITNRNAGSVTTGVNSPLTGTGIFLSGNLSGHSTTLNGKVDLDATGGATALSLAGPGTFSIPDPGNNSTIDSASGPAVDINPVAPSISGQPISIAAKINTATGRAVQVQGRNAGTVTFSDDITDSGTSQGIRVANNTNGSTVFSGATKALTTGANTGVEMSSNGSHTVRFQNGGLDVTSTSGRAFTATGGGTVEVSGSTNVLSAGTGGALQVSSTNIDAAGLTFRSIGSAGAGNGIELTSTGSSGGLTVTGTGIAPSGGTITGSTGAGIELTSVGGGASFDGVNVASGGDDGVRATTVTGLSLVDSTVTNNGNSHAGGAEERGLDWLNVTGTLNITRTTVSGSDDTNGYLLNTSAGTATVTVDTSTFSDSKFNTGLRLRGEGSSTQNATITGSTFSLNADPGFSVQTNTSNTAHQTVLFNNNNLSGGSSNAVAGRPQVSINTEGGSVGKFTISNNHIKPAAGSEITINSGAGQTAGGSLDANVTGNTINDAQPGAPDALADSGSALLGWAHGDGATRVQFTNNLVQNWGGRGLELSHNDGVGTADYTVTGNTLNTPDAGANHFEGMYVFAGGAAGDSSDVCVDMRNNDFDGIGQNGVSDLAIDRFTGNDLRFAGYNNTTVPGLQTFLRSTNPLSPALTVETFSFGPTATAATSCAAPVGTP